MGLFFFDINIWCSFTSVVISRILFSVIRSVIFDDAFKDSLKMSLQHSLFLLVISLVANLQIRYAGYLFAERDIQVKEGDQLLDGLD